MTRRTRLLLEFFSRKIDGSLTAKTMAITRGHEAVCPEDTVESILIVGPSPTRY
jgi:hypothetical protein